MLLILLCYVAEGLLLMGLSLPMIQKRIKPNPIYGFRTRKTLSDERIWYAANRYCGVTLFITGGVIVASALLFAPLALLLKLGVGGYIMLTTTAMAAIVIWAVAQSFLYLRKL